MNLATILGARPQFIKAATLSNILKHEKHFNEIIIHTGQHFDQNMSDVFFKEMNIPTPNFNLGISKKSYGNMINQMTKLISPMLRKEKIDGVIVYGDTNSTLAGSLAAKQLKIPIFHVESGLRSYNRSMPEENNRIITDHISSLLFCPTELAIRNLKKENIKNGVFLSGDIMYDSFLKFKPRSNSNLESRKYILATIHRRENISSPEKLSTIFKHLKKIDTKIKVIFALHPHTKEKLRKFNINSNITFIEPLSYTETLRMLSNCELVITDSGGLQKESFFSKKKCITVRNETEWTELLDTGTNVLCEPKNLYNTFEDSIKEVFEFSKKLYGEGNAGELIVNSIKNFFN